MEHTDGQYIIKNDSRVVLLRNSMERFTQCLGTFCWENIWRGSQREDRVEIKKEN